MFLCSAEETALFAIKAQTINPFAFCIRKIGTFMSVSFSLIDNCYN